METDNITQQTTQDDNQPPVDTQSTVDESFDLETYRQNLKSPETPQDTQITELQSFIKEQNQAINDLRSEISELKKVNFALANRSTVDKTTQTAESVLSDVFFGKEK